MSQPGNTVLRVLEVIDQSGNPVTGLTTGSFTVISYGRGYGASIATAYSAGSTIQSITSNLYDLSYLLPAAAGFFYYRIYPTNMNYSIVGPSIWSGEVETQDLASIAALVTVPVATITTSASLGMPLALECIPYRYRALGVVVKTQAGATVDLTAYNNFALSIRSKDQQTTKWDALNGQPYGVTITGDSSGNLALVFPESSSGPLYATAQVSHAYQIGDFVVPVTNNGWIYRCTVAGTSSGSAPTWPIVINTTVVDGTVTWTAIAKPIWLASTAVALGAYVRPKTGAAAVLAQYWICTQAGTSGASEPAWPTAPAAGATISDGTGGTTATYTYQSDWYAALISAGANGSNSATLYYELTGNLLATDETVPIIQSSLLTLSRREVGT